MPNWTKLEENLKRGGFTVSHFTTGREAANYLNAQIDSVTVGFGGSVTLDQIGLYDLLAAHNDVSWHWHRGELKKSAQAEVYVSSVNGLAETGEIVNIDGTGNRVASLCYGHSRVFLVVGVNKICPDYAAALDHAEHVAAPLNAKRLNADPEDISHILTVLWKKPGGIGRMEVVLVDEKLGY